VAILAGNTELLLEALHHLDYLYAWHVLRQNLQILEPASAALSATALSQSGTRHRQPAQAGRHPPG